MFTVTDPADIAIPPTPLPERELHARGYVADIPDAETAAIDSRGLAFMSCRCCPGKGLDYVSFVQRFKHTDLIGKYRPFMVCAKCGDAREF